MCLVTGASRGIGKAIALALGAQGARVGGTGHGARGTQPGVAGMYIKGRATPHRICAPFTAPACSVLTPCCLRSRPPNASAHVLPSMSPKRTRSVPSPNVPLHTPTRHCAQVAVNYAASSAAAEEVAAAIKAAGGDAIVVGANVAKRDEIERMFKEVTDKWGRVDVLVNNAGGKWGRKGGGEEGKVWDKNGGAGQEGGKQRGMMARCTALEVKGVGIRRDGLPVFRPAGITRDTLMMRMKPEQWEDVISTNLSGVFYCTQVRRRGQGAGERRQQGPYRHCHNGVVGVQPSSAPRVGAAGSEPGRC